MDRKRLETEIEKHMHGLVSEVREHVVDYTVLTVRKRYPHINREQLTLILDIVRQGIDDGFMNKIDRFMGKLDGTLIQFTAEENPLGPGLDPEEMVSKTKKGKVVNRSR